MDATEYVLTGGRKCVIFQLIDDHSRLAVASQYHLQALLDRHVDGLIVLGRSTDLRPFLGRNIPVPVVYV